MINPRVLIVASCRHLDLRKDSAAWMGELGQPYLAFNDVTETIALTSPGRITISLSAPAGPAQALSDEEAAVLSWIAAAVPIGDLDPADFDILFIAGNAGSATDMIHCRPLIAILEAFVRDQKPLAAIGLGVNALLSLFTDGGEPYVKGKKLTALTNREVTEQGLQAMMPFSLESRLRVFGAAYSSNPGDTGKVVRDGMLVTGQNATASAAAALMVWSLAGDALPAA